MSQLFDPNGVGIANGNIFGFPTLEEEANIVITPIPWDATASYGKGTSNGPKAILEASTQLDFFHPQLPNAWETKVYMSPVSKDWQEINDKLCLKGTEYIAFLENGGILEDSLEYQEIVDEINTAQEALKINLKEKVKLLIERNKIPAVLGGEHSTPLGLIEALNEKYQDFGILQIDAHADLRIAYEGFQQSHASIMYNALSSCKNLSKLVQVGIRDIAQSEIELIEQSKGRIKTFFDWNIKQKLYEGNTWKSIVSSIIEELPKNVYISYDIDGLKPYLCPNTGTPVPGGFELEEINYLLFELLNHNKKIIGFDLNEVGIASNSDWDANVGARALWNLVCLTEKNIQNEKD